MHTFVSFALLAAALVAAEGNTAVQSGHTCPMNAPESARTAEQQPGSSALTVEQVQKLLAGEGMGQAKPAESNGYPGPRHALDLADALKLTPGQRAALKASFDRMNADARKLGAEIVQAERNLYAAFESHSVKDGDIEQLTMRIGHLQAALRARHLRAHLETVPVLTPEQVNEYRRLRQAHEAVPGSAPAPSGPALR